ncbi:MAG: hypothetical protein ACI4UM_03680 [Succinivibrio sp.]
MKRIYKTFMHRFDLFAFLALYCKEIHIARSAYLQFTQFCMKDGTRYSFFNSVDMAAKLKELTGLPLDVQLCRFEDASLMLFFTGEIPPVPEEKADVLSEPEPVVEEKVEEPPKKKTRTKKATKKTE